MGLVGGLETFILGWGGLETDLFWVETDMSGGGVWKLTVGHEKN